jgi:hypothetical protein
VEADEANDITERWVGFPVRRRRVDPRRGLPVLVRRQLAGIYQLAQGQPRRRRARPRQRVDHGDGLRGSHASRRRNAGRRNERLCKAKGRVHCSEVKTRLPPPVLIDPRSHAPRIARSTRFNCWRAARSLTGGVHHDRSGQSRAHARSLRHGTEEWRRAVTSACPRHPLHARPRRLKRRARGARLWPRLWALNGPVPYQVRTTLEWPEHEARKA